MDRFRVLLLALLILQHGAANADDPTELIGAVGGSITFQSHNPDQIPAFWNFGTVPIVTVIFRDGPQAVFSVKIYEKRFSISEDGHALTLSQLSMEDNGNYSVKIGSKISTFSLHVYRPLPQPTVTCEAQNCSAGSCLLSLRCSAPGAGLGSVRLGWSRGQRPWAEGAALQLLREPSPEGPEPLTCTARNPVSSSNVTVTDPGGLCNDGSPDLWPRSLAPSPENATHPPGPEPRSGSPGRVVAVAVAEAAALSSVFLLFHCRARRGAPCSSSGG